MFQFRILTPLNSDLKQTWTATKRKACMPGRGEMELEERLLGRKYKLKNKQNERSRRSDFRLPAKKIKRGKIKTPDGRLDFAPP